MLFFRLGQTISVDDILCDLLPVHVNDHNIQSFEVRPSDGERQAFVYKDRNGGYTVTGILAVDMRKKVLKLARPLHKSIEKYDCDVFQFSEPAELLLTEVADLRLFRKYYRHCHHFGDPRASQLAETAAELPLAETALPLAESEPC